MATYTLQLGGLSDAQHLVEELSLPILPHLGAVADCRKALDLCAGSRVGIALVGPKGAGKSVGIELACGWFADLEREKRRRDDTYRIRKVLRFREIRCKTDREVALLLARRLDAKYSERANGAKKTVAQIRADVVSYCFRQQYAVIVVDEAETFSDEALQFFRDVLRDARDNASQSAGIGSGSAPAGIGLLLVGDDSFDPQIHLKREAGERWRQVIEVKALDAAALVEVYHAWFPGFAPHVEKIGAVAWATYLSSQIGRGGSVSFRYVENQARLYAHYMVRSDAAISSREEIPFKRDIFEAAAKQCAWAHGKPDPARPQISRQPRSKARGAENRA